MTLLPFEVEWARSTARALMPSGTLAGALDDIDAGARYADECATSPWHVSLLMRATLWLVWLAPLWLMARPRTFGALDATQQAQLLERLLKHRVYLVRTTALFLKMTLCQVMLGDEATLAQLGAYDLGRKQLAQLGRRAS